MQAGSNFAQETTEKRNIDGDFSLTVSMGTCYKFTFYHILLFTSTAWKYTATYSLL